MRLLQLSISWWRWNTKSPWCQGMLRVSKRFWMSLISSETAVHQSRCQSCFSALTKTLLGSTWRYWCVSCLECNCCSKFLSLELGGWQLAGPRRVCRPCSCVALKLGLCESNAYKSSPHDIMLLMTCAQVAPPLVELFGISSVNDSMMILVALGIPWFHLNVIYISFHSH